MTPNLSAGQPPRGPRRLRRRICLAAVAAVVGSLLIPGIGHAAPGVPTYEVSAVIAGSLGPIDANNTGIVVTAQAVPNTLNYTPLISIDRGPWAALPVPAGATSARPVAVNDSGLIAGTGVVAGQTRAIRWVPGPSGYAVEVLPWLSAYGTGSVATGINNAGQIVGARASLFGGPDSFGWLYSDTDGLVDLLARYGRNLTPTDINNAGVVLAGGTLDLATGVYTIGPPPPAGYQGAAAQSINDAGHRSGYGPSTSQSLPSQGAFRAAPGAGWQVVGTARDVWPGDVNAVGDASFGVQAYTGAAMTALVYLDGIDSFSPNTLLSAAARTAGWLVTGGLAQLTDTRSIVVYGRNTITGQAGTLILTPTGQTIPVPAAPTGLTATPHPATSTEKWVSIDLAWQGNDPNTIRYEVQRALIGTGNYSTIAQPNALSLTDSTVALATAYDYRVRAIGVSGASPWSGVATATSPAQPLDTTAPTVTLSGPADGSTVSGVVTFTAAATDDVGVTRSSVTVTNSNTGYAVELGSTPDGGPLTVAWNTAGLPAGTYGVQAAASDALGNQSSQLLWLQVSAPTQTAKVGAISLRASERNGVVTATGVVTITTLAGAAVPGATVTVTWALPNGSVRTSSATTDSRGRASFTTSGGRGTYTLTVTGVTKTGYVFDPTAGPRSRSITR